MDLKMIAGKRIPIQSQTITAHGGVFLFFVLLVLVVFTMAILDKQKATLDDYLCLAFLVSLAVFFVYLPKLTRMEIYNEGFTKKELFKDREFLWEEVLKVDLDWHFHMHGVNLFMKFKFKNSKEYLFPLTFHSRKNIRILCEAIVSACPDEGVSEKIKNMADGKFPWYIF